ncbi:hypothetical protein CANARDRAFT_211296 [[Candida] arabinofermentans NRRL YB-2248]|uniref:Ubiquitin-like protease family profile domain-containing protein n=1 Tax=[Candida] arabinofermentans NRRL YB-2248 TaxID=983967 RepID=A0A1E4T4V2_9ASCO|nr:hypothetical protein CANARDRAFT_211296 [[Candida] arabinofermentans NRRL YB-2248]
MSKSFDLSKSNVFRSLVRHRGKQNRPTDSLSSLPVQSNVVHAFQRESNKPIKPVAKVRPSKPNDVDVHSKHQMHQMPKTGGFSSLEKIEAEISEATPKNIRPKTSSKHHESSDKTVEADRNSPQLQDVLLIQVKKAVIVSRDAVTCTLSDDLTLKSIQRRLSIGTSDRKDLDINIELKDISYIDKPNDALNLIIHLKTSFIQGVLQNRNVRVKKLALYFDPDYRKECDCLIERLNDSEIVINITKEDHWDTTRSTDILSIPPRDFYNNNPSSAQSRTNHDHQTYPRTRNTSPNLYKLDANQEPIEQQEEIELPEENVPHDSQVVFEPKLSYTFEDKRRFVVSNNDFKGLYNSNWINDSIVDFFLKYDLENAKLQGTLGKYKIEVMNSFFYTSLTREVENEDYYSNVKSWFKTNNNLFDNDFVIIPINKDMHWFFVIIANLPKVKRFNLKQLKKAKANALLLENQKHELEEGMAPVNSANEDVLTTCSSVSEGMDQPSVNASSEMNEPNTSDSVNYNQKTENLLQVNLDLENKGIRPSAGIFILDSLRKLHNDISTPLKSFLSAYASDKYGCDIPTSRFMKYNCSIPQQKNFNDCGLHVIYNIKKFYESPSEFKLKILSEKKRKRGMAIVAFKLFDDEERRSIRQNLRTELIDLLKNQVRLSGGDPSTIGKITNADLSSETGTLSVGEAKETTEYGQKELWNPSRNRDGENNEEDDDDVQFVDEKIMKSKSDCEKDELRKDSLPKSESSVEVSNGTSEMTHCTKSSNAPVEESVPKFRKNQTKEVEKESVETFNAHSFHTSNIPRTEDNLANSLISDSLKGKPYNLKYTNDKPEHSKLHPTPKKDTTGDSSVVSLPIKRGSGTRGATTLKTGVYSKKKRIPTTAGSQFQEDSRRPKPIKSESDESAQETSFGLAYKKSEDQKSNPFLPTKPTCPGEMPGLQNVGFEVPKNKLIGKIDKELLSQESRVSDDVSSSEQESDFSREGLSSSEAIIVKEGDEDGDPLIIHQLSTTSSEESLQVLSGTPGGRKLRTRHRVDYNEGIEEEPLKATKRRRVENKVIHTKKSDTSLEMSDSEPDGQPNSSSRQHFPPQNTPGFASQPRKTASVVQSPIRLTSDSSNKDSGDSIAVIEMIDLSELPAISKTIIVDGLERSITSPKKSNKRALTSSKDLTRGDPLRSHSLSTSKQISKRPSSPGNTSLKSFLGQDSNKGLYQGRVGSSRGSDIDHSRSQKLPVRKNTKPRSRSSITSDTPTEDSTKSSPSFEIEELESPAFEKVSEGKRF